jgi:dienelactone hydrolase
LETVEREGYTEYRVQVPAAPEGMWVDGYLLIPKGPGPFPAVIVPFYEPLTSIGRGDKGRGQGTHDYGLQLVKRGFVTLSIGTPRSVDRLGGDTRDALIKIGKDFRLQPLTVLAYVAANCLTALAQMPEVDPQRIGVIGLSYGGKWSMFASCLDERFACAVWSDPGIVFNENDSNVNYWEPWYLGYDPKVQRKPGVPSSANPRTGLYKEMIDTGRDLVDLHALMAPRPLLVSGGVQDPPKNWRALNHLVAVNDLLGRQNRVFLTARKTHIPTSDALELELAFLEHFLNPILSCDFEDAQWWRTWGLKKQPDNTELVAGEAAFGGHGKSLKVTIPRGTNTGANFHFRFQQQLGQEPQEIYFRYYLKLDPDWKNASEGGKLPGISATYGKAGWGGRKVDGSDGWSARGHFKKPGPDTTQIGYYCYHADMKDKYGDVFAFNPPLHYDRWYSIEMYCKLNTPGKEGEHGKKDGILKAWIDGQPAFERTDLRFRDVAKLKIESIWINVYHGGTKLAPQDLHLYLDEMVISNTPIGMVRTAQTDPHNRR